MNEQEFIEEIKELGITLSNEQLEKFRLYAKLLLEYNTHTNLTAIKTTEEVYLKHFYDSLTLAKVVNFNQNEFKLKVLDIGSGAGFPGIVLAICFPKINVDVLDSNHKKIDFLKWIQEKLELNNIKTIYERAENYTKIHREEYDLVTSRAVASLRILIELAIPALKINGSFLAMKSDVDEELQEALSTIKLLESKMVMKEQFDLPKFGGKRTILEIKKFHTTDSIFPRAYNMILKKPLKKKNN